VIDGPDPPLYRLFAESCAQIGVGSTAVYEGLCFDLETFVFDTDGADVLRPLVEDGSAMFVKDVDDFDMGLESVSGTYFDRERFFKSNAVENIIRELEKIKAETVP
jgi:hypothetical protein